VPDVISALRRREQRRRDRDELNDMIERPRSEGSEKGFQFRERLFDRIEIRTVGREEAKVRAGAGNRRPNLGLFVHREVIENDDITGPQGGHEDLLDVREEARVVDRSVEHGGGLDAIRSQRRDDRLGLPMATRRVVMEPGATRTPAIATQQIGRHPALIEEDVLAGVTQRQPRAPPPAVRGDVRAPLLVGVYGFFSA
jgi:hypothetical protein